MNTQNDNTPAAAAPDVKPLPDGYMWRLVVVLTLLISACVSFLFISTLLGSVLMLSGLAFGKLSGLNDMTAAPAPPPEPEK
jgi:hypothetical protein